MPGIDTANPSNGWSHVRHTTLAKWQLASDFLIAIAYFSIPLELVYFLIKSQVLPFRWVIALFGTFIVLCGTTHLLTLWTYYLNSEAAHIGMTLAKAITATISCLTAVLLIWVIPVILDVKKREEFYTQKTAELDVEVGNIKKDQQVLKHVRMLSDEIRSSLDRNKILNTTMIELAHTLELESCNIWLPRADAKVLELAHKLGSQDQFAPLEIPMTAHFVQLVRLVSILHKYVFSHNGAVVVPGKSLGALAGAGQTPHRPDSVVAVRIPLLRPEGTRSPEVASTSYALMVLALPLSLRKAWGDHELELVEAVADQVAVALSHATVVEESRRAQDLLIDQNLALQKAKREAESAVIARNEFLVVMNHEMRTPMHAIIALSSLLLESNLNPDQASMVETISKSGSLLSTLINDVLDFSRLEAGSLSLDPQPFKLGKLLDDAERLVNPLAQAKKIPITMKRMLGLPDTVLADSTRLLQVVLNVVGNAIKFTTQGHVTMSVFTSRVPDDLVSTPASPGSKLPLTRRLLHFEVQDTGIGIKATDIPRLFNKFVQADSSTSRKYGGSGLGLAISKKFVELMGGTICIESEGLDKGSTCRFHVCVHVVKETEAATSLGSPKPSLDYTHLKILAVDDNAVNRTVIKRLLTNLGCKFVVVDSGENCLKQLAADGASAYRVVLVDLCMPEMDGYQLTAEIQSKYPDEKQLFIVALTANTDDNTKERCLSMGMKGVLTKPVSLNVLKKELKVIFGEPQD